MKKWDIMELMVGPWHKSTAPGTIKKSFQIPGVYRINKEKWNLYFKGNDKKILSSIFGSKENESSQPSHSSQTVLSISYSRYQEMVPHFNSMQFSDNNNVQTENTILAPFQPVLTQPSQSTSCYQSSSQF